MRNIEILNMATYDPTKCLMIYESQEGIYVEEHPMIKQDDVYVPGAGQPVTLESLYALADGIKTSNETIHTQNILQHYQQMIYYRYTGIHHVVWLQKPIMARLPGFRDRVHLPPLVFKLRSENLDVLMCDTVEFKPETVLYHPLMPNISSDGSVCLGNWKHEKTADIGELIKQYSMAFFQTKFNSFQFSNKSTADKWWDAFDKDQDLKQVSSSTKVCTLTEFIHRI